MRTRLVRHSELKDWRACPLKHHWRWVEGWAPGVPNAKLALGTQWHLLMQHYFTAIKQFQQTVGQNGLDAEALAIEVARHIPAIAGSDYERQEILTWMFAGYVEQYGVHPDWQVVAVEKNMVIPLFYEGRKTRFRLSITPDLIVRQRSLGNRLVTVDHKSTGYLARPQEIDLDDQLGVYMFGVSRYAKEPVLYPMLSQSRTMQLKRPMLLAERYALKPSWRSPVELTMIEEDLVRACREMVRPREGLPHSSPNPLTCTWSCDFVEAHIAMRRSGGRDTEQLMRSHGMTPGNPIPNPGLASGETRTVA